MKNSTWIKIMVLALLMSLTGFADVICTLDSSGALWKADSSDVNGTKTQLATLPGGASYIDSAFDGQYLYGLRDDGAVYRSDLSGNVSAVSLTGWDSSIKYINADSGTLYGMNSSNNVDVLTTDGIAAVHIGISSAIWGDFTVTDDGRIWLLNVTGGAHAWVYGFTNGYSGALSGYDQYFNFSNGQLGYALASAGNEFYCAYNNNDLSVYTARTTDNATAKTFHAPFAVGLADMATGTDFYTANVDGTIQSTPLTSGTKSTLGTLGSGIVGLEVIGLTPPTIVSLTPVSGNVLAMVVDAPGPLAGYYPATNPDLVVGTWTNVAHSDTNTGPFIVTNLAWSAEDGSYRRIYVEANSSKAFFGISEQ